MGEEFTNNMAIGETVETQVTLEMKRVKMENRKEDYLEE